MAFQTYKKNPGASLDYTVSWANWLETDETISSVVWTVDTGITEGVTSNTPTTATIWLGGGTVANAYNISCKITTSSTRIDDRTFTIDVRKI